MAHRPIRPFLASLLSALLLAACGGSGGGGGGNQNGNNTNMAATPSTWWFTSLSAEITTPEGAVSWGTIELDGAGGATVISKENDGTTAAAQPQHTGTFTVDANRDMNLTLSSLPITGRVSEDGQVMAASAVVAATDPNMLVAVLKGGTHSLASVAGTYAIVAQTPVDTVFSGEATFSASGSFTWDFVTNGGVGHAPQTAMGTYTVSADGAIAATLAGGNTFEGGISPNTRYMTLGGATTTQGGPAFFFLIRRAPGNGNTALLNGSYLMRWMGHEVSTPFSFAFAATATADGNGVLDLVGTQHSGGTLGPNALSNETYAVAADGSLGLPSLGGMLGAVSADGSVAAFAGPFSTVGEPLTAILIR